MNPILQATIAHVEVGKKLSCITVDNKHQPTKVFFEFVDGTSHQLSIECDHQTFMDWWKRTGRAIRLLGLIKPLEDLD